MAEWSPINFRYLRDVDIELPCEQTYDRYKQNCRIFERLRISSDECNCLVRYEPARILLCLPQAAQAQNENTIELYDLRYKTLYGKLTLVFKMLK